MELRYPPLKRGFKLFGCLPPKGSSKDFVWEQLRKQPLVILQRSSCSATTWLLLVVWRVFFAKKTLHTTKSTSLPSSLFLISGFLEYFVWNNLRLLTLFLLLVAEQELRLSTTEVSGLLLNPLVEQPKVVKPFSHPSTYPFSSPL